MVFQAAHLQVKTQAKQEGEKRKELAGNKQVGKNISDVAAHILELAGDGIGQWASGVPVNKMREHNAQQGGATQCINGAYARLCSVWLHVFFINLKRFAACTKAFRMKCRTGGLKCRLQVWPFEKVYHQAIIASTYKIYLLWGFEKVCYTGGLLLNFPFLVLQNTIISAHSN